MVVEVVEVPEKELMEVRWVEVNLDEVGGQKVELWNECDYWDQQKWRVKQSEVERNRRGHERKKGLEEELRRHDHDRVGAKWLLEKENIFLSATDEPEILYFSRQAIRCGFTLKGNT